MNANRMISMVIRMVMRKVLRRGVDAGIDTATVGRDDRTGPDGRKTAHHARKTMKLGGRMGRF